jgi:hypothetical protein
MGIVVLDNGWRTGEMAKWLLDGFRGSTGIPQFILTCVLKIQKYETFLARIQISRPPLLMNNKGIESSLNVVAHAQKLSFVFRRNGRVHLNRRGRQFSRLLAAEVCASAVVMLDTPCSEVVWRVLATHSIRQFSLHFPSRASLCAITCQLESTMPQTRGVQTLFIVVRLSPSIGT